MKSILCVRFIIAGLLGLVVGAIQKHHFLHNRSGNQIAFTYNLDSPSYTSAGVYNASGVMVRTLWPNGSGPKRELAGNHAAVWDDKDDSGNPVSSGGPFTVQVVKHNIRGIVDGFVGSTMTSQTQNVLRTFWPLGTMNIGCDGSNLYLAAATNEQQANLNRMPLSNPNTVYDVIREGNASWVEVASDGHRIYAASKGSDDDTTSSVFLTSFNVSDDSKASFASGASFTVGQGGTLATYSVPQIDGTFPTQVFPAQKNSGTNDPTFSGNHAPTGLAVEADTQGAGNLLACSVKNQNVIEIWNKTTGALLKTISTTAPGELAFDASGNLLELSGTILTSWSNLTTTPTASPLVTGLSNPINVATNVSNPNEILVADAGTEQVYVYNSSGTKTATLGTSGGYDGGAPAVHPNAFGDASTKFGFFGWWGTFKVPLCEESDGSFWVGDPATNRLLHFSSSLVYQEQIMWTPQAYTCAVDENAPTHVFYGFSEFVVDYTKPIVGGDPQASGGNGSWKLVNWWGAGLTASSKFIGDTTKLGANGFSAVFTLSNGRRYGLIKNSTPGFGSNTLAELVSSTGLRDTGFNTATNLETVYPDGSKTLFAGAGGLGTQTLSRATLTGFDGSNNPTWSAYSQVAQYTANTTDPVISAGMASGAGGYRAPVSAAGRYWIYNSSTSANPGNVGYNTGMRLGSVAQGGTAFITKSNPAQPTTSRPLDLTLGEHQTNAIGNGSNCMAQGHIVVLGAPGEFWFGAEQDAFEMFYDDGLPLSQMGTSGDFRIPDDTTAAFPGNVAVPGMCGNALSPGMCTNGSDVYLYTGDEAEHGGVTRFHLVGAQAVRVMSGIGSLGQSITLTETPPAFPTALSSTIASTQATISWIGVSGATSYNVKRATHSGGPYTTVSSGSASTSFTDTGLTNEAQYFYVVSAVNGSESVNSDEIEVQPYDTSVAVHPAGKCVYSTMFFNELPMFTAAAYPAQFPAALGNIGNLINLNVGSTGYVIYDNPAHGVDRTVLPAGWSVGLDSHWNDAIIDIHGAMHTVFNIDGVEDGGFSIPGASGGFSRYIGPTDGTTPTSFNAFVTVTPPDSNFHLLTLVMPPISANAQTFDIKVTPHGLTSPLTEQTASTKSNEGSCVIMQFWIKGAVDIEWPSGTLDGTIKAVLID